MFASLSQWSLRTGKGYTLSDLSINAGNESSNTARILRVFGMLSRKKTFLATRFQIQKDSHDSGEYQSGPTAPEQRPAQSPQNQRKIERMPDGTIDPAQNQLALRRRSRERSPIPAQRNHACDSGECREREKRGRGEELKADWSELLPKANAGGGDNRQQNRLSNNPQSTSIKKAVFQQVT